MLHSWELIAHLQENTVYIQVTRDEKAGLGIVQGKTSEIPIMEQEVLKP